MQLAERSLIEIDEHPAKLANEHGEAGDLPRGIALITFEHADLDDARIAPLLRVPPRPRAEAPYLGRRTTVLRGIAGELIELVECASA